MYPKYPTAAGFFFPEPPFQPGSRFNNKAGVLQSSERLLPTLSSPLDSEQKPSNLGFSRTPAVYISNGNETIKSSTHGAGDVPLHSSPPFPFSQRRPRSLCALIRCVPVAAQNWRILNQCFPENRNGLGCTFDAAVAGAFVSGGV